MPEEKELRKSALSGSLVDGSNASRSKPASPQPDTSERDKPESAETIWLIVLSPVLWAAHFLACYLTAAIWCAKFGDSGASFQVVRLLIGVYTFVALAGITAVARLGHARHRSRGDGQRSHFTDTAQDRHSFLGFATYLLSVLSAVATIFVALAAVFVGSCE